MVPLLTPTSSSPSPPIRSLFSTDKGLRVTVKLSVQNRVGTVEVIPSASSLIIAALKEPFRDRKKVKDIKHDGDISLEQVYEIAETMREKSLAKTFAGTVTEILGTCQSIGCTVNGQHPHDVIEEIKSGDLEVPDKE